LDDRDLPVLEEAIGKIWDKAREMGLDPFPTHFEIVPATILYEFGAYLLPGRFSHWTHGIAYYSMKASYDYGLSKIYELVINTNPSYAFLMEGNSLVQNTLVAAHVTGHADFFKRNAFFANTNRQMVDGVSVNAERIRRYEFDEGKDEVERFLDAVLSIQEHVDPESAIGDSGKRRARQPDARPGPRLAKPGHRRGSDHDLTGAHNATPYDDLFELDRRRLALPPELAPRKFPEEPQKDILLFLAEHAPDLAEWQRDILHIVRSEMLYFVPQMQTKIMNEGWASFWHARIMRELELPEDDYIEFAQLHANVCAPSKRNLNPYYVGMKMFEDIERRWDNPTREEREEFGRKGGEGRAKVFEVRELENDAAFIRNYLTQQLVDDLDLYIYKVEGEELKVVERDYEKIRDMIVASMTNFGNPYIVVEDGDYHRGRELYLRHVYEGQEIDIDYAERTLQYMFQIWRRPVHVETVLNAKPVLLTFDGERNTKRLI
jgi:stage V sporulation protein R